jgi:hypothetical protein
MSKNTNNDWLPGEPKQGAGGDYFRLKDLKDMPGKSCDIRILCPFITGYEGWTEENRPMRSAKPDGFADNIKWRVENGKEQSPKPFWATAVWNRSEKRIQVWSFTQATIYRQLRDLLDNRKWGALADYDITITRKGDGTKTEYSVVPNPKEGLDADVVTEWKALQEKWMGLPALYTNEHPMSDWAKAVPF